MRLSSQQIAIIKHAVQRHLGSLAEVRVFGSRINDQAHGGDIDLYVQTDLPNSKAAIEAETALWADLQAHLGEQRIDLLIDYPTLTHRPPIFQVARQQGTRL